MQETRDWVFLFLVLVTLRKPWLHAGKREGLKHSAVATKPPSFIPAQFKLLFFI